MSLNFLYKDLFIPLADTKERVRLVCVIRELMMWYSSCSVLNFREGITCETVYVFWCSRCMFIRILAARNRLVFMIEESEEERTESHTQSVTRRRVWHSLKSELGNKVFFFCIHPARTKNL